MVGPNLEYSSLPKRRSKRKIICWITVLIAAIAIGFGVRKIDPLTSADIRLDTGDLRYRYFGIPLTYEPMAEPMRSQLLAIAAKSTILTPEWKQCAIFPLPSSNNSHWMCRGWYVKATAWIPEDPHLAQLILEDVATYIRQTSAHQGLPNSYYLLSPNVYDWSKGNHLQVIKGWRNDPGVQYYLEEKGYQPPSTQP